jgi:HAUS augmin-like complex subunit 4
VYAEAVAMVEEYHAAAGAGKKLNCSPQVLLLCDESSF